MVHLLSDSYLVSGVTTVVGLVFVVGGLRQRSIALASEEWPSVEGEIVVSRVKVEKDGKSRFYYPNVIYEYTIGERTYHGDRIAIIRHGYGWRGRAEQTLENYPERSRVRVYYDPESPSESMLEPGMQLSIVLFIALGVLAFGWGVFSLVALYRS